MMKQEEAEEEGKVRERITELWAGGTVKYCLYLMIDDE